MVKRSQISNIQLFLTLGGVAVAILNLWAIGKLSPLYKDIAVIVTRVDAVEKVQSGLPDSNDIISIEKRLDRLETKIDQLIVKSR